MQNHRQQSLTGEQIIPYYYYYYYIIYSLLFLRLGNSFDLFNKYKCCH